LMPMTVPFGQFVPGDSAIHRLDPRAKLGLTLAFTVLLFSSRGWMGLALGAAVAVAVVAVSRVPWRFALRGLVPVAWLLTFTLVANALAWGSGHVLVRVGPLGVSAPGLARGAFFAARITLLVMGTSVVTLTTSPVALTDALSRLMRPLRFVRVPVDDVAMMFSIALRFIPTTAEEADKIVVAQTARGARFDEGGLVRRAKAWVPVLVPLFVNLFRRADDLAIAMESRCYTGVGRTRLHVQRMQVSDWVALVIGVTATVAAVILLP
jgi:energy-coupling factor transport system permease protein